MAGRFRLRLADYRALFALEADLMRIFGVRHRLRSLYMRRNFDACLA